MARVVLERICKTFPGGIHAVRDVCLDVAAGEFVVLVGPSGCGKSTTLRMIAGLEDVTSGSIRIGERIVNTLHPKDRDIAMVFQNYALYPHMTVYGNMAFALKLRRTPKQEIERRVRDAARVLGIEDLLLRKPRSLSGGQRQRVAVGRAIVREPACFLFDEPLSNLDVKLRVQMRAELKALHLRLKTTAIYVTHDQEEAMTLGDRIAVMSDGRIQQVGPPLDVYRKPVNRFVAGFVGLPPMNFIEGRVEQGEGDGFAHIDRAGTRFTLPASWAARLSKHAGQDATLGVRPEALRISPAGQASAHAPEVLRGIVRVVEPLGDRQDVFVTTAAGDQVVARIDANETVRNGAQIEMSCRAEGLHIFEPGESGRHLAFA